MEQVDSTALEGQASGESADVDYQDLYVRTLADFDNYRKRIDRERGEIGAAGKREILVALLDVVDNFERAVAAEPAGGDDRGSVAAGFVAIYRQLVRLLETNGVERIEAAGLRFDPNLHEALGTAPSETVPEDVVLEELRSGYLWNGSLLRPAKVIVSSGPSGEE